MGKISSLVILTVISCVHCHLPEEKESDNTCPLWMPQLKVNESHESGIVKCERDNEGEYHLSLLPCYCLTEYGNSFKAVVGLCIFTCTEESPLLNYLSLPVARGNISELSQVMCKNFSRSGQMCGQCEAGHALPVYSYTLSCVNCTEYGLNWLKYIGIAFGPQTLFFVTIVFSRMSVTSGLMVGYVTVSQLVATGVELRFKDSEMMSRNSMPTRWKVLSAAYGVWNLDFFRIFYPPFCLNPHLPPLAVIALDYAVAIYPMCLIVITYCLLTVCGKYTSVLRCWAPFHVSIHRFHQACDIRNSIVDAYVDSIIC